MHTLTGSGVLNSPLLCKHVLTHTYVRTYVTLYPGARANYGWIKGKSVLTFVM